MIPKTIHYCWFGRGELTPLAKKCIASWRQFFPGYEIKEWNEDNFDVNCISYTADAYKAGKFAFVSDYARFWVLYHFGGVYFDTDVEVIKPMDDVLENGPFMGFELLGERPAVNPGLGLAAMPGMSLYKAILDQFKQMSFLTENGSLNPYTMIPMVTDLLKERGLVCNGAIEQVAGISIYPPDWFNPFDDATGWLHKTKNTRTIHWYAKSWLPTKSGWITKTKRLLRRLIGTERLTRLGQFLKKR